MNASQGHVPTSPAPPHPPARPAAARVQEVLHLFVLSAFAVAQPVYDRLGERPAYLGDMQVGFGSLVVLVAVLSVLLPVCLAALIEGLGRLFRGSRGALMSITVFVLLTAFMLPVMKRLEGLPGWLQIALALGAAGFTTWAYFAFPRVRSVVTVASPAVLVFPALFLFYSPASALFATHPKIRTESFQPVPVVVLVLDELRGTTLWNDSREIDAERFPHFAELARESTWFRNATTVYPDTWQALPAILSGRYPTTSYIPQASDLPQNLFAVLQSTGEYELVCFEPVSRIGPLPVDDRSPSKSPFAQAASLAPALGTVYLVHLAPIDLLSKLPQVPRLWFGMHDESNVDRDRRRGMFRYSWGLDRRTQFEHFIDCLDGAPRPALYFMHVLLPHIPWCYLPSGRKYLPESNQWELMDFDSHSEFLDFWGNDDLYVLQSQKRHVLQLMFADVLLGRMLERLRETGLYDRCLLVVTADHGICMRASEARRNLTETNLADIMSIPLFIKRPGQRSAEINDRNVESIDIFPTITDVLGIELKLPVDGRSVFDTVLPERKEKTIYRQQGPLTASPTIVNDSWRPGELETRLGPAHDPQAIYHVGPSSELIGRRVDELAVASDSPFEIRLIRALNQYSLDPDALVPSLVEGRFVSPPNTDGLTVAIAVNGVIQGTTRTYLLDGVRDRFSALLPESAFRVGTNDFQYYAITGNGPDLRLSRCRVQH